MKKAIPVIVFAVALIGAAAAQPFAGRGPGFGPGAYAPNAAAVKAPEKVTVEGELALLSGHIGIKQGDVSYYVTGLNRLLGFVDGLKEGAKVKVEGYSVSLPVDKKEAILHATSLTIGTRTIDLSAAGFGFGGRNGGMMGGMAGGRNGMTGNRNGGRGMTGPGQNYGPGAMGGTYGWNR